MRRSPALLAVVGLAAAGLAATAPRASGRVTGQPPTFRAGVDLVNVSVTVADRKGNLVPDLAPGDFELTEDGVRQTLSYFARGEGESPPPLHLGLLLDVSDSMGEDLAFTKTAAVKFLNRLTDAEDVTVMDFDTEVRAARYSQAEFARLIERIRQKKVSGDTAIYDAVGVYLDGAAGQTGRKIMILYTDGGDTRSSLSFGALLDLLKASDVTVYVIGMLEHQSTFTRGQQRMTMTQIAETTGGQAFFPLSMPALDAVYEKVLAEIRAQYTVGYVSTNARADGAWRKVEVRVTAHRERGLRIRARKGYFAPFKPAARD
jgi:Ca-activated chloride channel family protein